jgi:hypothetical protein
MLLTTVHHTSLQASSTPPKTRGRCNHTLDVLFTPAVCAPFCVQVLNKQVITRTSGRCLGTISGAWLDPAGGTLVSFDLDERKQGGSGALGGLSSPPRAGNIPLSALRQVGKHPTL